MKADANDAPKPLNVVQVKPHLSPQEISHSFRCDPEKGLDNFYPPEEDLNFATEIIELSDLLARITEMSRAIRDEINGLLQRGMFRVFLKEKRIS